MACLAMKNFFNFTFKELEDLCRELDQPLVHARTLFAAAYKDFEATPWEAPSIPKKLAAHFVEDFSAHIPEPEVEQLSSYDGSVKFLLRLEDGQQVEAVLMPEKQRITICISSQVGCRQACTFCHTGRMGLLRNLSVAEIVGQIVRANRWLREHPEWLSAQRLPARTRITNVVFMGMGEPLDNLDALIPAVNILTDSLGTGLSLKRVAVSTAGHLDGLKAFLQAYPRGAVAFSLHATTPSERSRLMPINRRWPMEDVLQFLGEHYKTHNRHGWLLVQYTVIRGVNDSSEHAARLAELLRDLPVKLNLIPLNEVAPSRFNSPDPKRLTDFRDEIHQAGIRVMIRYSKGQDIAAACGQLVTQQKDLVQSKKSTENAIEARV